MIDIAALHKKLETLKITFDDSFSIEPTSDQSAHEDYLVVTINKAHYCFPISHLQSVIKPLPITKIPCAPLFIKGVINLNGEITSVSDLHYLLDSSTPQNSDAARMILTKNLPFTTSIVVDTVDKIVSLNKDDIQTSPNSAQEHKSKFIKGDMYVDDRLLILLDMEALSNTLEIHSTVLT